MGLLLPHSVFIHIPKTGGTTVRRLCEQMGLARGETGHGGMGAIERQHSPYHTMMGETGSRKVFATVRRTLDWYRSLWMFKHRTGHGSELSSDENFRWSFAEWVQHVTTSFPGYYGQYLCNMLEGSDALLVPTHELFDVLPTALSLCDEVFTWPEIDESWIMNQSGPADEVQAIWTAYVVAMIRQSEGKQLYPETFLEEYSQNFVSRESGITV